MWRCFPRHGEIAFEEQVVDTDNRACECVFDGARRTSSAPSAMREGGIESWARNVVTESPKKLVAGFAEGALFAWNCYAGGFSVGIKWRLRTEKRAG